MTSITHEEIIYQVSKEVHEEKLSKKEGVRKLIEELNMNEGSAKIIIGQVYPKLIKGEQFSRTLSIKLFDYFLKRISEDYGVSKLSTALSALKLHIDYIAKKGDPKKKLRKIYQQYLNSLRIQSSKIEQKEKMLQLSSENITKIKNITNGETGKAYLNIQEKEFILHYPDKRKKGINETRTDELIVLYQRASKNDPRFLTHLVRPIDNEIIEQNERENFRFGHIVEVIAFTGDENKIPFDNTLLSKLDFRNHGWGNAENLTNLNLKEDLHKYQKELWALFKPFFNPNLAENLRDYEQYFNDELDRDFEAKEGKLLFRNHRIRERDSSISHKKKMIALSEGKYKCEVCDFSYQNFYGQNYIECHHKIPINLGERITKLKDLALVCSNCHRMLHRKINGKFLSVNELKELIKK